jgi:predicted transcriptional regulator of viral defense system
MQVKPAEFLATHAVFTRAEFEKTVPRGARSPRTVSSHLARWQRERRVRRVRPGLYVRLERDGGAPADPYAVASRLAPDAALAYHTALELHGHAQSVFRTLTFVTWAKTRPLEFEGHEFRPVRPRAALRKAARGAWTVTMERRSGPVTVTSLARTVVDVLDRPDLAGGMEEAWRSLLGVRALDFGEMTAYLRHVSRPLLAARLGYFLDRRREELLVPESLRRLLRGVRPRSPVNMEGKRPGRFVAAWNLVVPPEIFSGEQEAGDAEA